jgi:hypothetical protein
MNCMPERSGWRRHPVLPDDDLSQWSPLHAVVAIADAHGHARRHVGSRRGVLSRLRLAPPVDAPRPFGLGDQQRAPA